MLRTSISPNIIKGGYQVNVIPSEAEATLDIRALPDEDFPKFLEQLKQIVNDPAIEITKAPRDTRPGAKPSRIDTEAFRFIEEAVKHHYGVIALPTMITGATEMAYLRAACNVMASARWSTLKTARKASARTAIRSGFWKRRCTVQWSGLR